MLILQRLHNKKRNASRDADNEQSKINAVCSVACGSCCSPKRGESLLGGMRGALFRPP